MKYIEKVILENFQSHKNSVIKFDNKLNVIVGPSDSGKTAILRGIKWALYNEPSGDYFIREGESECSVTVIFNDSTKIKRYRSKSKNIYYLYDSNNNESKFEGFGTTVPQEIIDKIGIKKILLDNDLSRAINLSDQLDGAFLLSERGSVRANSIGRLVGVNVIDDSLRETLRDIRNLSGDKRHIDNKVLDLEEELVEYRYLEEFKNKIDKIEGIRNTIYEKEQMRIKYKDILEKISTVFKEQGEINFYIDKLKGIIVLDNMIRDISLNVSKYKHLSNQNYKFLRLSEDKQNNNDLISSLKHIGSVEENLRNLDLFCNLEFRLIKLKSNLDSNTSEIHKLKKTINNLKSLERVQILINCIDNKSKELDVIKNINTKESNLRRSLDIGKHYLKQLDYTDEISDFYKVIEKKNNLLKKLEIRLKKYISNKEDIEETSHYLIKLDKSFEKELGIYKNILLNQETCPLCFSNIDNDKIEHIISHYN